jgi:hypothetical protein
VPFPFDTHIVIKTDDVLGLERAIHKDLEEYNKHKPFPRKTQFLLDQQKDVIPENGLSHISKYP